MKDPVQPMIDVRILLALEDFRDMGDVALLDIATHAELVRCKAGAKIKDSENADHRLYLVQGEAKLVVSDRTLHAIKAGSERAQTTLFRLHAPGMYALCVQPSLFLRIDKELYRRYAIKVSPDSESVTLEEYAGAEGRGQRDLVLAEIRHSFTSRQVTLPSLPDVARHINHALQDQNIDFGRVAQILQTDPVIVARVLQVANSAMYPASHHAESLREAITRIGLEATRAIVISVVLRNLFKPIAARMQKFYETSIRAGVISHAIARRVRPFDPDHAFLAGLIHDIGVVPLLMVAQGYPGLSDDPELLESILKELRSMVGSMLMLQWGFDLDLVVVVGDAHKWDRDPKHKPDYCDIVQAALAHASMLGGEVLEAPSLRDLPAFRRLGLDKIDPLEGIKILQEAKQEIHDTIHLLTG